MFDGVHSGHRFVIEFLEKKAAEKALSPAVFTFSNHPLTVVKPEVAPKLLTTASEKERLLRLSGIEFVHTEEFTSEIRRLNSREYIRLLRDRYNVKTIALGFNNHIGCDIETDFNGYCKIGTEEDVEIIMAPQFVNGVTPVSSTSIRKHLSSGDIEEANEILGYSYNLSGKVISGKHLGRTIGFPTANIEPESQFKLIPANGVYVCTASLNSSQAYPAMVNIGHRPTVDRPDAPATIEAHLIGYDGDLYGDELTISFIRHLRSEIRFNNIGELKTQLEADKHNVLKELSNIFKSDV